MKTHRFFGDFNFTNDRLKITDKALINQVKNVLRLGRGDRIILADGKLNEVQAEITDCQKGFFEVRILARHKNQNEPVRKAILYCSILKRENFEWVVQKATEVGVAEITPLICHHTVKTGFKKGRLEKIIRGAAEQSGRGILPELCKAVSFSEAVKQAENNSLNLFFDLSGADLAAGAAKSAPSVGLFIGPEGGWDDFEIDLARQRGFKIVNLGKLTLRAETAAVVAAYLSCNS
jgi:16S rRNA (uracil1498-N3)-methyltransferase